MSETEIAVTPKPRFRWGLAIGSVASGLAALICAWVLGTYDNPFWLGLDEQNAAFWSGLLVNIGTTIALAFLLIVFERFIITQVRREGAVTVQQAETKAKEAASDAINTSISQLDVRIDELDAALKERGSKRADDRLQAASQITTDTSFEAFVAALDAAASIGAITGRPDGLGDAGDSEIIVPAGSSLEAPRITITHVHHGDDGQPYVSFSLSMISIEVRASWHPGTALIDVLDSLLSDLLAQGAQDLVDLFEAKILLENLSYFLDAAISARHRRPNAWLSGNPAHEMVAKDCVITEIGIETEADGLIVSKKRFGHYQTGYGHASNRVVNSDVPKEAPEGLDQKTYTRAVQRARRFLLGPDPGMTLRI